MRDLPTNQVHGKPCKRCQSTVRYITANRCVRCRKEWRKENDYRALRQWDLQTNPLFKSHGINAKKYNQIFEAQGGVCAICKQPEVLNQRLAIDHCHKTQKFRGLLCNTCNRGLGQFRDSPETLRKAADYLENNGWSL